MAEIKRISRKMKCLHCKHEWERRISNPKPKMCPKCGYDTIVSIHKIRNALFVRCQVCGNKWRTRSISIPERCQECHSSDIHPINPLTGRRIDWETRREIRIPKVRDALKKLELSIEREERNLKKLLKKRRHRKKNP